MTRQLPFSMQAGNAAQAAAHSLSITLFLHSRASHACSPPVAQEAGLPPLQKRSHTGGAGAQGSATLQAGLVPRTSAQAAWEREGPPLAGHALTEVPHCRQDCPGRVGAYWRGAWPRGLRGGGGKATLLLRASAEDR